MRKLAIFTLGFAAGTLCGQYLLPRTVLPWVVLGSLALMLLCGFFRDKRRKAWWLLSLGVCLSLGYYFVYTEYVRGGVAEYEGEEVPLTLSVLDYAETTGTGRRIAVRIEGAGPNRGRGMLYGDAGLDEWNPGDQITGTFTVSDASVIRDTPITSFTGKGVWMILFPHGPVERSTGSGGLRTLPQRLRRGLAAAIGDLFPADTAPFLRALLLGDRSALTREQESDLGEVGLYHITAVSGMHFGYLFWLLSVLVGYHRPRRLAVVAVPVLMGYMVLTGGSASVVRACVMLIFVLAAPLLGRESDPLTSLSAALLVLLLTNPCSIAGVGLQLSFTSMVGLLLLAPKLYDLLPGGKSRIQRFVRGSVAASMGTAICTAPLTALYFNRLPLVGPVANLFAGPAAALTFLTGLIALVIGLVIPPLGRVTAVLPHMGAGLLLGLARMLARIPFHAVYFTNPYLRYWLIFLLALGVYCILTPKARRKYLLAGLLSAGVLALLVYLPIRERSGRMHVVAVDVGQGAGTILASQGRTALVDCGSSNSYVNAGRVTGDALNTYGYFQLDYLILTHYHADHINGVGTLLARVPVEQIIAPLPGEEDAAAHLELQALARHSGCVLNYLIADTQLPLGEAVLRLWAPFGDSGNEKGVSLVATAGEFDVLITGDMNMAGEKMLAECADLPDVEVLLVGHHGSRSASSTRLLRAAAPEVGIISVGDNHYGHPANEAMRRLVGAGVELYRTDQQGSISVVLGEKDKGE